ncbi:paraquat-inducible protein A [Motiliproteus sp. SC1-56]|uniref:paraquat-inducible protein A n=1 Tax=Motiliproteus sp. SC1-56 TaxID=2799565 RepID=UPI001A8EB190|nr:paraquat-inducible protein A [Motiliproteus sp. SC1-56]
MSPRLSLALQRRVARALILFGLLALGSGLTAPMMTLEQFYFWEDRVSLLSALLQLARGGHWPLALLLGLFSVLLPVAKLLLLANLAGEHPASPRAHRYLRWMQRYGRWSMLDVFVVAVLVAVVKLGGLVAIELHYGFYLFAAAILITLLATALTTGLLQREAG